MRTTLTLDDDISVLIERLRAEKRVSLRQLINESLRLGLNQMIAPTSKRKNKFKTESVDLGKCKFSSLDDISEVLSIAEGENYK